MDKTLTDCVQEGCGHDTHGPLLDKYRSTLGPGTHGA